MESKYKIVTTTTLILNQAEALWLRELCKSTKPIPIPRGNQMDAGEPKEEAIIRGDLIYALDHVTKGGDAKA